MQFMWQHIYCVHLFGLHVLISSWPDVILLVIVLSFVLSYYATRLQNFVVLCNWIPVNLICVYFVQLFALVVVEVADV